MKMYIKILVVARFARFYRRTRIETTQRAAFPVRRGFARFYRRARIETLRPYQLHAVAKGFARFYRRARIETVPYRCPAGRWTVSPAFTGGRGLKHECAPVSYDAGHGFARFYRRARIETRKTASGWGRCLRFRPLLPAGAD